MNSATPVVMLTTRLMLFGNQTHGHVGNMQNSMFDVAHKVVKVCIDKCVDIMC